MSPSDAVGAGPGEPSAPGRAPGGGAARAVERAVIALRLLLMVLAVDLSWVQKERTLRGGRQVFLALAPVDPRSLMQGDYMRLDYAVTRSLSTGRDRPWIARLLWGRRSARELDESWSEDGFLVVRLVPGQAASFVRRDAGEPLAEDELRLRYRVRAGGVRVGTDAFYFEEGTSAIYENARHAELRVDAAGDSVLVGLCDAHLAPIGARLE